MFRGELKIERDTKPSTNRVNVSGDYDYDISKNVVTFTSGGVTKNIKVLSIDELSPKKNASKANGSKNSDKSE